MVDQLKKVKKNPDWFLIEAENIYKAYIKKSLIRFCIQLTKKESLFGLSLICIENHGIGSQEWANKIIEQMSETGGWLSL